MDRRTLIKSAAVLAAPAIVTSARAQNVITLRLHTFVPATSNVYSRVIVPWMAKIEQESGGRLKFQGFPSMQMGGTPAQLYDQAREGVVDIVWSLAGYTPGRFPRTEAFELPFFTYDAEGSSRAAWEYIANYAPDEFREVKLLACHTHGLNILHMKNKLVTKAGDLRGLKVRGPSRKATQILTAVGATPVGMPLPAIPDALSKGVVEGAILPWDTVPAAKLDELTKFHTEFPKGMQGFNNSFQFLTMNKARYDSLPADLKKVIDQNSGANVSAMYGREIEAKDPVVRQATVARGNTVHVMGKAEAEEFRRLTNPIVEEWVKEMNAKGFDGAKLLAGGRELVERYRPKA
jgi:TRAP-type C4-dicarboxylate transport system substrate-binding protein